MVVVRKPAPTKIATVTDPLGDAHGGPYDLTGAGFATIADQFITSLYFSRSIDPSYATLNGRMVVDSDQSLSTGDLPLTGNIPLGTGIPTWGGDAVLDFRIDSLAGPSFTMSHDAFYDPSSDPLVDFGGDYNDGRWAYSGNTLTMTSSLSTFDPVLTKVHLAVDPGTGQVVPDEDLSSRIPTDGRMYASLSLNDSYTFQAYDLLPDTAGVVDTATGRAVPPLTWDSAKTVSFDDPREFGNDLPTSMDLTRVDAEVTQGNLVVKGSLSGWLDTESNNEFLVLLDTDMAATGARESNPDNGGQEIGGGLPGGHLVQPRPSRPRLLGRSPSRGPHGHDHEPRRLAQPRDLVSVRGARQLHGHDPAEGAERRGTATPPLRQGGASQLRRL